MSKRERQLYILEKVAREGRALTREIVEEFGIAEDTVRKDFQELAAQGKVQRFHGGILRLASKPIDFNDRINLQSVIKKKLAKRAAEIVRDKQVLYIDGGTTNLKLAESIPEEYRGTVITNAPATALALCRHSGAEVIVIGGTFNKLTGAITGNKALEQLREINIECCVLGVSSISDEKGITFPLYDEAVMKQELIRRSGQVIVIADRTKLGSVAAFGAAEASAVDILITDETDEEILERYRALGIEIIAEPPDAGE